jgi:CHAT domain-containing protein
LAGGHYDGWHFSGHGAFASPNPDRSEIRLEDGSFYAEQLSGVAQNLGRSKPLVFLNACQVGQGGMSLTGVGGWASRFLAAGAGAFIGPLWSVYDKPACDFARKVYSELIAAKPIAEAVKNARLSIKQEGNPTWLAYSLFAYPLARVS